jgi:bifunctional DNase/RNase
MDKFIEATVWNVAQTDHGMTLMLKLVDKETVIPIFLDQMESQTLFSVWRKNAQAHHRPRIYETFRALTVAMNLPLYRAEIYDIQDSLFRANILFAEQTHIKEKTLEERLIAIETSPVDACVLALMSDCPICVSQTVIQKIGIPVTAMLIESFKK